MALKEQIVEDLKKAMKEKDEIRFSTLRLIRTEIVNKEKEKPDAKIDDEAITKILQSMTRRSKEAIEGFEKGGRQDLVAREKAQLKVIESYLPEKVSPEEMQKVIEEVAAELKVSGPKETGKVMGQAMQRLKETGKLVDGRQVNQLVRQYLTQLEKSSQAD